MSKVSTPAKSRAVRTKPPSAMSGNRPVNRSLNRPGRKPGRATAAARIRAARTWPQRLMLHPLAVFAVLFFGACLIGLTCKALASDFSVSATVAAPLISQGATIASPEDGTISTTSQVVVSGSCPNEAYVKLFRNTVFSGVAICKDGAFSIQTDLFPGKNLLQAQDYSITDVAGPVTAVVTVTYQLPVSNASDQKSSQTSGTDYPDDANPLPIISTDYHFAVTTIGQNFSQRIQMEGGRKPYDVSLDWGDKTTSTMTVDSNHPFTISHHYDDAGYYTINVHVKDVDGRVVSMQLVALVRRAGDAPIRGAILSTQSNGPSGKGAAIMHWLLIIWPTYVVLIAMIVSFLLGERRELLLLTTQAPKPPRLRHS